jgi:beta-glucosidase
MNLMGTQIQFLNAIVNTSRKFILVMLVSKPLIIPENVRDAASAIFWQFCPGNLGGNSLARAVFGEFSPSGRLSISVPRHVGQQPIFYYKYRYWHGHYVDVIRQPVWAFGHGIGYTEISYLGAKIDKNVYHVGDKIHVSVTIKNIGTYDTAEVIQIYAADLVTSVTWVGQLLKGFKRQPIKAGEVLTVDVEVDTEDLWLINAHEQRVVEPGAFELRVGKASNDIKFRIPFTIE